MTPLEITLIIILWLITGCFISYKRKWYTPSDDIELNVTFTILFAPIALVIALFKEFILDDWNNQ